MLGRLNYPLILGVLIVIGLILVIMFEEELIMVDPYATSLGEPLYIDGEFIIDTPPLPPSDINILGTDILGRDIYSRIIAGTSITLKVGFLIVLFRLILAIPTSLLAGFGSKTALKIIKFFSTAFSAIPALMVSFFILNLPPFKRLNINQSIISFVVVLTFIGWARLAYILQDNIKNILNKDFIQGEIAIGKSKFLIAVQNVIPHLLPTIIVSSFFEMGKALMMIAALGVFGVYVDENNLYQETIERMRLSILPCYYPEWGGMLSTARYGLIIFKPWIALFPALAFLISIMGFNLLGEGIAYEVNKKDSKVIPWIKRLFFHLSPLTYIYEIRHFNDYKKNIAVKTSLIIGVIIIILLPSPRSIYELDEKEIFKHVEEFSKDTYEGRLTGTKGRDEACNYIINEFREAGIKPFFDDDYIFTETINEYMIVIKHSTLRINNNLENKTKQFIFRKDYNLHKVFYTRSEPSEYKLVKNIAAEILTYEQFINKEYDKNKQYFVVLDWDYIKHLNVQEHTVIINSIIGEPFVFGIVLPTSDIKMVEGKVFPKIIDYFDYCNWDRQMKKNNAFIITTSIETAKTISEHKGYNLTLNIEGEFKNSYTLKNIAGMIEGKDKKGPIVLATGYDYYGYEKGGEYKGLYENGTSISSILEIAKGLNSLERKPEKTIIFVFLDSSLLNAEGAGWFVLNKYITRDSFYIYIDYLGIKESKKLYLDSSFSCASQGKQLRYIPYIKKRAKELEIPLEQINLFFATINSTENALSFNFDAVSGLVIKGVNISTLEKYEDRKQDDISVIDKKLLKQQAQLILDTIVRFAY